MLKTGSVALVWLIGRDKAEGVSDPLLPVIWSLGHILNCTCKSCAPSIDSTDSLLPLSTARGALHAFVKPVGALLALCALGHCAQLDGWSFHLLFSSY